MSKKEVVRYKDYRKIYEKHHGPVPVESNGRKYHIHHVDGDRTNNNPENLIAVTAQRHFEIHYEQGDIGACLALARILKIPSKTFSELCSKRSIKLTKEGRLNLLRPDHRKNVSTFQHKLWNEKTHNFIGLNEKRLANGSHNFLNSEFQSKKAIQMYKDGTHPLIGMTKKQLASGTHPFQDRLRQKKEAQRRIEAGTHNFLGKFVCPHCQKIGGAGMLRWHFDYCKYRRN